MHDEEGHFRERRIDYDVEFQLLVKRGNTRCEYCPFYYLDGCKSYFKGAFKVDCSTIDLSTLEVHGL